MELFGAHQVKTLSMLIYLRLILQFPSFPGVPAPVSSAENEEAEKNDFIDVQTDSLSLCRSMVKHRVINWKHIIGDDSSNPCNATANSHSTYVQEVGFLMGPKDQEGNYAVFLKMLASQDLSTILSCLMADKVYLNRYEDSWDSSRSLSNTNTNTNVEAAEDGLRRECCIESSSSQSTGTTFLTPLSFLLANQIVSSLGFGLLFRVAKKSSMFELDESTLSKTITAGKQDLICIYCFSLTYESILSSFSLRDYFLKEGGFDVPLVSHCPELKRYLLLNKDRQERVVEAFIKNGCRSVCSCGDLPCDPPSLPPSSPDGVALNIEHYINEETSDLEIIKLLGSWKCACSSGNLLKNVFLEKTSLLQMWHYVQVGIRERFIKCSVIFGLMC